MSLKSTLNAMFRKRIEATGQAQEVVGTKPGGTAKTKSSQRAGVSFYLHFFTRDRVAFVGMVMIGIFLVWAFIEGVAQEIGILTKHPAYGWALLPSDPFSLNFNSKLVAPTLNHFPNWLFGTNYEGQSLFSRILYAAPHDAEAPIIIVGSAVLIGMFLGSSAGYFGGWIDEALMRVTDAFLALPALILAITVGVLLGSGFTSLLLALILVWWPTYARFFRVQSLTLKERGYVESSKLSGSGSFKILVRHIIPNSIDPIIAYMTLDFGTVILVYSVLAFLGIGISLNYPEWGEESSFGLGFFPADWWWAIIPGVIIAAVVIAFTLVGDRLQDLISGRMSY